VLVFVNYWIEKCTVKHWNRETSFRMLAHCFGGLIYYYSHKFSYRATKLRHATSASLWATVYTSTDRRINMEHFETAIIGERAIRGQKPVQDPFYPPVIVHWPPWYRKRAFKVIKRRLITWPMARPLPDVHTISTLPGLLSFHISYVNMATRASSLHSKHSMQWSETTRLKMRSLTEKNK